MTNTEEIIDQTAQQPVDDSFEAYEAAKASKDAAPVVSDDKPAVEPQKPIETSEKTGDPDGSKQEGKPRRDRTAEGRIAELTNQLKAQKEEFERWKAEQAQAAKPAQVDKKPEATPGKPKLDDFVNALTADERYETAQERYAEALMDWREEQAAKRQKEQDEAKRTEESQAKVHAKVEAAMSKYEDFGELMSAPIPASMVPAIQEFIQEFDTLDALHAVLSDPGELERISKLSKARQLVELGKIDDRLSKPEPKTTPPPVSKAPAPIRNIGGAGAQPNDDPFKADSFEAYERARKRK